MIIIDICYFKSFIQFLLPNSFLKCLFETMSAQGYQLVLFLKMGQPRPRTRIVRVEGEHADH